ncbi:MAG: hypothetical protein KF713_16615 [Turneriella sp.]|nr:hypothetical protein [Turneriella sp.]
MKSGGIDDLLTSEGKKVGTVKRLSDTESDYLYDPNQNGRPNAHWITENGQMKIFEKFDPASGKLRTKSYYLRGLLNRVEVFDSDGRLRGIVNYPDGTKPQSVELPRKRKLVEFIPR